VILTCVLKNLIQLDVRVLEQDIIVLTLDQGTRHVTGHAGNGNMKIYEVFSPLGGEQDEMSDVNWMDDLKFFISNDTDVLSNYFFPAVRKHKEYGDHPNAYKIYIKPIEKCKDVYIKKYKITEPEAKFPKGSLITLAKKMAEEQKEYIKNGDYENNTSV
jgi:hypothetical protein